MERAVFFIDGVELFAVLDELPELRKYKWLDIKKLVGQFLPEKYEMREILYFTSLFVGDDESVDHQRLIASIYKDMGIDLIFGEIGGQVRDVLALKTLDRRKRSDLNIGSFIFEYAALDKFDTAFLFSSNPRYTQVANQLASTSYRDVIFHIPAYGHDVQKYPFVAGYEAVPITVEHLEKARLPEDYKLKSGKTLSCPDIWH